jgi:hypothetical protein
MVAVVRAPPLAVVVLLIAAVPARARAQAEPAPPEYVPPGHERPPTPPSPIKNHIGVDARLPVPLGQPPPDLPQIGWGAGVQLTRALVDIGGGLRVGVGFDFAYQRVQHTRPTNIPFGGTEQFLSQMTFAALVVLDGIYGRWRPWLAAGGGFSVAQYEDPMTDQQPGTSKDGFLGLVQLALGVSVEMARGFDIGLGGQFDFTFSSYSVGAPPRQPWSPGLFSARLDVGFRF